MKLDKSIRYALLSALLAMVISAVYIKGLVEDEIASNKVKATFILENQAQKIKSDFLFTMEQVYQLRSLIYGSGSLEIDTAPVVGRILENPVVRNLLYAPRGIVEKVIPYKGNEGVIGLNLLGKENKSREGAIAALKSGKLILSGPYELKQGGKAFSGRVGVINTDTENSSDAVGIVSITVDFPDVIEKSTSSGLLSNLNYEYSLLKKDPETKTYFPILSNQTKKQTEIVDVFFSVSNIDFCLQAAPKNGWFDRSGMGIKILSFLLASITTGLAIGLLINARERLIDKATKDPLTGMLNRTGAMTAIENLQKISQYKRGAVVILDLDNFKKVNDVLGHQTGDDLLCDTAKILKETLRDTDMLSRLGGDEFLLYLPFIEDETFVSEKLEEIRKKLERTVSFGGQSVKVSSSIGVTLFDVGTKEMTELYKEADNALYMAKEAGKNKVCFYR